ncbi:MAG TPA: lytic transglycosylase domain-containing protein [Elusimicrobiota bacterium]|jgi:soluble lytic murein transglycosylase-like protein|nr:lytic transglycosylase domain-containing protein [Elusimicrobiota bacterium]
MFVRASSCVFVVLSIVTLQAQAAGLRPRSGTLVALNSLQASGANAASLSELFEAASSRPPLPMDLSVPRAAQPALPFRTPAAPPAYRAPARTGVRPMPAQQAPFVVSIPDVPPPAFAGDFRRLAARPERTDAYDAVIQRYSYKYGLDPRLVKSIVAAESEFVARAVSPVGARGLLQLMPATAAEMGVGRSSLFDPEANLRAGIAYLAHLFARAWKRYHMEGVGYRQAPQWIIQRVLAAYNAGPRFLACRRLLRQTCAYVRKVLLFYRSSVSELRPRASY